jgi:hypothetical protein
MPRGELFAARAEPLPRIVRHGRSR